MLYHDTTRWRRHLPLAAAALAVMAAIALATGLLLPAGGPDPGKAAGAFRLSDGVATVGHLR